MIRYRVKLRKDEGAYSLRKMTMNILVKYTIYFVLLMGFTFEMQGKSDSINHKVEYVSDSGREIFSVDSLMQENIQQPENPEFKSKNNFDWGSFSGALFSGLAAMFVAIFVFNRGNKIEQKKKRTENEKILRVFVELIDEIEKDVNNAITRIKKYIADIEKDTSRLHPRDPIATYFISKLDLDVLYVAKIFFEFGLTGQECVEFIRSIEYFRIVLVEIKNRYADFNENNENKTAEEIKKCNKQEMSDMRVYNQNLEKALNALLQIKTKINDRLSSEGKKGKKRFFF